MNFLINTRTGYAYDHVYLPLTQTSTFHFEISGTPTKADTKFDALPEIEQKQSAALTHVDDWTDEEEQEWDALFAQPHVQKGLQKLAEEAERQVALGEFEEGGFAVE